MLGKVFILVIVMILFSCTKNKDFGSVKIIGHAANGLQIESSVYHDNTNEALNIAMSFQGCDGVELDVHVSKDQTLWLYHDQKLDSQTNLLGCISEKTDAQLLNQHYNTFYKERLIPLIELEFDLLKGKELVLDFRHLNACSQSLIAVQHLLQGLFNSGIVYNNDFELICLLSNDALIQPFLNLGLKVFVSLYQMGNLSGYLMKYPAIEGFVIKNTEFSADQVKEIKKYKKVYIFEMRSPKGIRKALQKQPDAVITDDVRATIIEKY